jgi:hypothetical protein
MQCKPWGSFEAWSRLIAHCVVWTEMPDPQRTRAELEMSSNTSRGGLATLLRGWEQLQQITGSSGTGLTSGEVIRTLYTTTRLGAEPPPDKHAFYSELREAIESMVPAPPGRPPSAQRLGMYLFHASLRMPRSPCLLRRSHDYRSRDPQ